MTKTQKKKISEKMKAYWARRRADKHGLDSSAVSTSSGWRPVTKDYSIKAPKNGESNYFDSAFNRAKSVRFDADGTVYVFLGDSPTTYSMVYGS